MINSLYCKGVVVKYLGQPNTPFLLKLAWIDVYVCMAKMASCSQGHSQKNRKQCWAGGRGWQSCGLLRQSGIGMGAWAHTKSTAAPPSRDCPPPQCVHHGSQVQPAYSVGYCKMCCHAPLTERPMTA